MFTFYSCRSLTTHAILEHSTPWLCISSQPRLFLRPLVRLSMESETSGGPPTSLVGPRPSGGASTLAGLSFSGCVAGLASRISCRFNPYRWSNGAVWSRVKGEQAEQAPEISQTHSVEARREAACAHL